MKTKLNAISLKRINKPLELNLEMMDSAEGRQKFRDSTEEIGVAHLDIVKHLADLESDETLRRLLLSETKCIVRLYMVSGFDLASRDNGSFSDPYLVIQCGKKVYNERENYQEDNPNPDFYKSYDFEAVFPGCAPIVIKAYDYDLIFGDDLIGETSIDLEDRFFMPEWQSIKHKPIEYRQLYHESSACSQGQLKLWVEIIPTTIPLQEQKIFDITKKPVEEYEVRVVVWDTLDVVMADAEGTSDVYIRAFFDAKDDKETDTHFRCTTGKASFNYRLKFTVNDQRKNGYNMTLQVYDKDFFSANEILGETTLNLNVPVEDTSLTKRPVTLNKKYCQQAMKDEFKDIKWKDDTSFFVDCYRTVKGKKELGGKVRISVDVFPMEKAIANEVGHARQEPNHSPFCPPPVGRISFTLNPFKMFNQLVGPALRRKIYCACVCIACIALCVMLAPIIFGNIISGLINKAIGIN